MITCNKCKKEFKPTTGLKNYCSIKCRNSRVWTEADKLKKSEAAKNSNKVKEANRRTSSNLNSIKKYQQSIEENRKKKIAKIIETPFDELKWSDKRIKIYHEQDGKCNRCRNNKWQGENIPLELEHKDGNNINNDRNNLELLCPNCHALTDTWRGRNKKGQ